MNDIDYRRLLIKYIDHVGACEGINFLGGGFIMAGGGGGPDGWWVPWTQEEIDELRRLQNEAY